MDTHQKLELLAEASRFDLSCACSGSNDDRRKRGPDGLWVYPASLPRGGRSIMLKTLMSNACVNDCKYCPFRQNQDTPRCTIGPDELAATMANYAHRPGIFGLFLSSGVLKSPDHTMDRMTAVAALLRKKHRYRGYLHLKIIPGSSNAAIEHTLSLASAVSVNVEAPNRRTFAQLSDKKDYDRDIVNTVKTISQLTARGTKYAKVKQSTQFLVGAADETDSQIINATFGLYKRLKLQRVYYSAYQTGLGDPSLPGENLPTTHTSPLPSQTDHPATAPSSTSTDPATARNNAILTREHRLYQADFLIRKYGFNADEIPTQPNGNLSLTTDPKQAWADNHPEQFPIDINRAPRKILLRIPGLGPITVSRILKQRKSGTKLRRLTDIAPTNKRLQKAAPYIKFSY